MVITVKNFNTSITKGYKLGEIDSRLPYFTDQVPKKNTEAVTAGQVLIYDVANNYYTVAQATNTLTNCVVAVEDAADTATRINVLITGLVAVETTTVLV